MAKVKNNSSTRVSATYKGGGEVVATIKWLKNSATFLITTLGSGTCEAVKRVARTYKWIAWIFLRRCYRGAVYWEDREVREGTGQGVRTPI